MKRLNKKGFTLVELLAAIVILAVLMLVGAQAVGGIMRSSRANSLLSSLDMAVKQANMKIAAGELTTTGSALKDVLNYNEKDYKVWAKTDENFKYLITSVETVAGSGFASVRCSHGKINDNVYDSTGNLKALDEDEPGYYCEEKTVGGATFIKVYKVEYIGSPETTS